MSKDLVPIIPDDLQNITLRQLMQSDDVEIKKCGNKLHITKDNPDSVLSVEYTQYAQGKSLAATEISTDGSKKGRKDTVRQMRAEGKTQVEIARRTKMSQAYVSMLLHEDD